MTRWNTLLLLLVYTVVAGCARSVSAPTSPIKAPSATPRPFEIHIPIIAVQPLGRVPKDRIEIIRQAVARQYQATVEVLPAKPLPAEAYYKPRGRYRADKLLTWLDHTGDLKYNKVLGLTESDISTTKGEYVDWGVFGLGSLGGRPCVISSYRLRNVPKDRFRARYTNLVIHELGHTFGLDHCPTKGCVMQDAQGTVRAVDEETGDFCKICLTKLRAVVAAP